MSERAMRLRLGVFVLLTLILLGILITLFSGSPTLFRRSNAYTLVFPDATGVAEGTPVRRSGVRIGEVKSVELDDETGDVSVRILLDKKYLIRRNEQAVLAHGVLGDTHIDFVTRKSDDRTPIEPGAELQGEVQADVGTLLNQAAGAAPAVEQSLVAFARLAQQLDRAGPNMEATAREYQELARDLRSLVPDMRRTSKEIDALAQNWSKVGARVDDVIRKNQDQLTLAVFALNSVLTRVGNTFSDENQRNLAAMLKNFTAASAALSNVLNDETQRNIIESLRNLRTASAMLPTSITTGEALMKEARLTLKTLDVTFVSLRELVVQLQGMLRSFNPDGLYRGMDEISERTIRVLAEMEGLLQLLNHGDGMIQRMLSDPSLYDQLTTLAGFGVHLLPRMDQMMRDMQVFVDKIARHPEILGAGGLIRPSNGVKEAPRVCPVPMVMPGH
jgi:phospholipid/cholesterol/gamma-HCH transport system substrate-binding protein